MFSNHITGRTVTWHHREEKVLLKSDLSQGPDEDSYITQGDTISPAPASERETEEAVVDSRIAKPWLNRVQSSGSCYHAGGST